MDSPHPPQVDPNGGPLQTPLGHRRYKAKGFPPPPGESEVNVKFLLSRGNNILNARLSLCNLTLHLNISYILIYPVCRNALGEVQQFR